MRSGSNALDHALELGPESAPVFYTDGRLDASTPQSGLTSRQLCSLLADQAAVPEAIVRRLEQFALSIGAGRLREDIAIVAARVDG